MRRPDRAGHDSAVVSAPAVERRGVGPLVLLGLARIVAAVALALPVCAPAKPALGESQITTETLLNRAFMEIGRQRFDAALDHIEALIRARPNFRMAHFIKGDLLLAKARPLATLGNASNGPAERILDLREEAVARLRAYREPPSSDRVPRYLLKLLPEQKYAVVVDTGRSRLYLFRNDGDQPRYAGDYYISSGKRGAVKAREGDQKTPVGVYHVTSSLPRKKLSDFYGHGAYPINYPNEWDRRQGRNGHGIWLHGTPSDTYSRPPRASDGCVVLSNADLDALATHLQIGLTPVIISEGVEWLSVEAWTAERKSFMKALDQWRGDWESLDTDRYLDHYSPGFAANGQGRDAWGRHKRQVNGAKRWVKIGLSNVSLFRTPGAEEVVEVTFDQDYQSSNLSNMMTKRQYWLREGGRWRIVYEGAA